MSKGTKERAAAKRIVEQQKAREKRRTVTLWTSVAVVVVLVIAGLIGWAVLAGQEKDTGSATVPPAAVDDATAFAVGSGPVKIDIYEDFMCPICGEFEQLSKSVLDLDVSKGTLQVEYRPISFLDRESNGTEYSTRAANAFACVADNAGNDAALTMHNLLYANQPAENTDGLPDSQLVDLAVQAGASRSAVQTCVDNQTYKSWVANVTEQSSKDGVNGTPTAVLNGSALTIADTMNPTALQQAIDTAAS